MSNENKNVEKFDPAQLMQGVKDRIKSTFVSLIPDEQWEQMVKVEIDNFFKLKDVGYNNNRQMASDFQLLVRNEINQEARKRLGEYLNSAEFAMIWSSNGYPIASEAVKNMIVENSGQMLVNFFGGICQGYVQGLASQLQR